jgi:RNA polymerase sigma-70 factor (ECF subfamily)
MSPRRVAYLFAVRIPLLSGTSPEEEAEARQLARARQGDPLAFRALFEQHAPGVWRFLRDLFRDDAAADEATQETFVRAHRRLGALRDETRLASWLLGIARHVYLESRRPRGPHWDIAAEENEPLLEAMLPNPSPEDLLLDRELAGLLTQALGELREERRAALLLRIDHGLAYEEIAQVMGWSLPKVKTELHRARLQLRERLDAHVGTGGRP